MSASLWLLRFTAHDGKPAAAVHMHNCIADYRELDPAATVLEIEAPHLAKLVEGCRLLIAQYKAVPEFTMGGALTNEPFTKIADALDHIGGAA